MDNLEELFKRVKQYILNQENHKTYNSDDFPEIEDENLDNNECRLMYMLGFERANDPFTYVIFTTIRPIRFLIGYDEDINKETGEITNKQLCFLLQTDWEEDQSMENSKKYHYFVNDYLDFDLNKVKDFYNNLCDKLPRNNFNLVEEEIEEFFKAIK